MAMTGVAIVAFSESPKVMKGVWVFTLRRAMPLYGSAVTTLAGKFWPLNLTFTEGIDKKPAAYARSQMVFGINPDDCFVVLVENLAEFRMDIGSQSFFGSLKRGGEAGIQEQACTKERLEC